MQPVSCAGCQALERRLRDLQAENERLRHQLDEATRAGKRQAAPFAKGPPTGQPKKPGHKPGKEYGPKAHRQPPRPEQIDEVHEAPSTRPRSHSSSRSRSRASPFTGSSTFTSAGAVSAAAGCKGAILANVRRP